MKFALLQIGIVSSLLAPTAWAGPRVTEIRLKDIPGFVPPPIRNNEFVFRADGSLYWIEGTRENPVRHRYSIQPETFQRLVASLEAHQFVALKPRYDGFISDGPTVVMSVTRGGQTKTVEDYSGLGPSNLWELEMIVRGVASQWIGLKRVPKANPKPTPTPTPIPVFRGTKGAPN